MIAVMSAGLRRRYLRLAWTASIGAAVLTTLGLLPIILSSVFVPALLVSPFVLVLLVVARRSFRDVARARPPRSELPQPVVWELRAPDPGTGQCPVCGAEDLDYLARFDLPATDSEDLWVVPYGEDRAHRTCSELVPETVAQRLISDHRVNHHGGEEIEARDRYRAVQLATGVCGWCYGTGLTASKDRTCAGCDGRGTYAGQVDVAARHGHEVSDLRGCPACGIAIAVSVALEGQGLPQLGDPMHAATNRYRGH